MSFLGFWNDYIGPIENPANYRSLGGKLFQLKSRRAHNHPQIHFIPIMIYESAYDLSIAFELTSLEVADQAVHKSRHR